MYKWILLSCLFVIPTSYASDPKGHDEQTGLIIDTGYELVKGNCTVCHSAKIIVQNRLSRESWLASIRWMQETQGLWPLSVNEKPILDYLEKNYGPTTVGRRANLPAALLPVGSK
ncbi:hypothetical protein [Photobacterium minamisatsumaniensis]|uniref:hypothetical protein n=1 Tax=Photobacterium minamisatsumaniensis TaxID=2910233 RepID=UPI003D0B9B4B